jgi:Helix-turn-helix domain
VSRRVAGLRRTEVALLAEVSGDYYVRLERGRERTPSPQVVDALARASRARRGGRRPPARAEQVRRRRRGRRDEVSPVLVSMMTSAAAALSASPGCPFVIPIMNRPVSSVRP